MPTLLRLIALLLFLIALLTGGCSLVFSVLVLTDPGGDAILPIVLISFAVGGACFWAGSALLRRTRKSDAPPPPAEGS